MGVSDLSPDSPYRSAAADSRSRDDAGWRLAPDVEGLWTRATTLVLAAEHVDRGSGFSLSPRRWPGGVAQFVRW